MVLVKKNSCGANFLKPSPIIIKKKLAHLGCALCTGDHDWDNPTGEVQRQGLG